MTVKVTLPEMWSSIVVKLLTTEAFGTDAVEETLPQSRNGYEMSQCL